MFYNTDSIDNEVNISYKYQMYMQFKIHFDLNKIILIKTSH